MSKNKNKHPVLKNLTARVVVIPLKFVGIKVTYKSAKQILVITKEIQVLLEIIKSGE